MCNLMHERDTLKLIWKMYKINFSLQLFGFRFVFALAKYLVKHLSIIVPLIEEPSTSWLIARKYNLVESQTNRFSY